MQPQNPEPPKTEQSNYPENSVTQNVGQSPTPAKPPVNTANIVITPPPNKSHRWKLFFIALAIANIITIVYPWVMLLWLTHLNQSSDSGFFGRLLIVSLWPLNWPFIFIGHFVAAINVLTISFFLYKHKPKRLMKWLGLTMCLLSIGYIAWFSEAILVRF